MWILFFCEAFYFFVAVAVAVELPEVDGTNVDAVDEGDFDNDLLCCFPLFEIAGLKRSTAFPIDLKRFPYSMHSSPGLFLSKPLGKNKH